MTLRERVLSALTRRPIDRTPRLLYEEAIGYTPPIAQLLRGKCAPKTPRDYFGMDITSVVAEPSKLPRARFGEWLGASAAEALASGQVDEWGVWWRAGTFHHFAQVESPLREYPWPDLDHPYRFRGVAERVAELHAQGLAVAAFAGSVFEQSW